MESGDVTVLIPTYNNLFLLKRTIACLERQRPHPGIFQTVVVDDGSSDGTGRWLRDYTGLLTLEAILLSENRGRAAARNAGAARADRQLLLLLDGDMEFGPDLVLGHAQKHGGEDCVILGRVRYDRSLGRRGYAGYIETRGPAKLSPGRSLPGRYFLSGHASMPRRLFQATGGFDERFHTHGGEDLDLGMRLVANGARLIWAPELVVKHLHIRSLSEVMAMALEYGRRSVPLLIEKHPELYQQLKLDWPERKGLLGTIHRALLSKFIYQSILTVVKLLNEFAAPAALYDYLLFRSYYTGYREALSGGE